MDENSKFIITQKQLVEIYTALEERKLLKVKMILIDLEEIKDEKDKGGILPKVQNKDSENKTNINKSPKTNILP